MDAEKERRAVEVLKSFEPQDEPYYLCYSGGKDSDCIRILAQLAGVKHDVVHNLTTVDAPETVNYVKSVGAIIDRPPKSMWKLITEKLMPPTRMVRYCCSELKERGGKGRLKITGVRWSESTKRAESAGLVSIIGKPKTMQKEAENQKLDYRVTKAGGLILNDDNSRNRRMVEYCYRTTTAIINPIVDWSDKDVWEFLNHYGCESNPLYKCGYKQVGCIGCPMARPHKRKAEFNSYPQYRLNYIKAFERMLEKRKKLGKDNKSWKSGEDVMRWWLEDYRDINQITFDELIGSEILNEQF